MSTPQEPTPPVQPVQPALPDLSDFITNPGKPPKPEGSSGSPAMRYAVGAVVGLALLGVGFGVGRATASSGPGTLVAAVQEEQAGKLPCGTPSTSTAGGNAGTFIVARLCGSTGTTGGAGGFGGGTAAGGTGGGFAGRAGALGGLFGPGSVTGTVTSVSGSSLQLQTRAGTITVQLPPTAKVTTTAAGSLSDVTSGHSVVVTTTTSGTTRTATSIFVLPAATTSS
jgi:hypothetical protein